MDGEMEEEELAELADENRSDAPFLSNIVQQPHQKRSSIALGMSLAFPSPRLPAGREDSAMELTGMVEPADRATKRPRYSLFPKAVTARTDAEVVSVLQTPPVRRFRPSLMIPAASAAGTPAAEDSGRAGSSQSVGRPSSILKDKMKRFMDFSGPFQDGGDIRSESEATDVEMDTSSASGAVAAAKQLRFNLNPPLPTSPEGKADPSGDSGEVEKPEEVTAMQLSLIGGEDSQFLSFEEQQDDSIPEEQIPEEKIPEGNPAVELDIRPPEALEEEEEKEEAVYVCEEEPERIDSIHPECVAEEPEDDRMEWTRLDVTMAASGHELLPVEIEDAPEEAAVYQPMAAVPEEHPAAGSDEESDIVCLDSGSEEPEPEEEDETGEEEEEFQEEEEENGDRAEELEEPEEPEEEKMDGQDSPASSNDSDRTAPLPPFLPSFPPQGQSPFVEEQEPEELEEPEEPEEVENYPEDEEDSSCQSSSVSVARQVISTSSHRTRFAISSSEDEPEEEDEDRPEEDRYSDDERSTASSVVGGRRLLLPPVTGFSAVEPDLEEEDEPEADADAGQQQEEEEEETDSRVDAITGYSRIESDLDEEDEPEADAGQPEEDADVITGFSRIESDLEDSDTEPGMLGSDGPVMEEEEKEEETTEPEADDFELKLTPASDGTVRPAQRRRFSMSSASSSDGQPEEMTQEEEIEEEEIRPSGSQPDRRMTCVLIQPEMSPACGPDRSIEQPEAQQDEEEGMERPSSRTPRAGRKRIQRSSIFIKVKNFKFFKINNFKNFKNFLIFF